ncbi:hypothetical protein [uncultured Desulfobulbus sp.]|uniref:hypothetical protein n=1 Tax=uncultured Desulfobulbus sp. TaxID=239745 RepID=UPI0029C768F0|nr:hypothetical protein [uncultured Desulfobulbus sp.]
MGCCEFELLEMSVYRIVLQVKNQHRTGKGGPIPCHLCNCAVDHAFIKKRLLGFNVRINCPQCGWTFEG